jgi:hypothetical protein
MRMSGNGFMTANTMDSDKTTDPLRAGHVIASRTRWPAAVALCTVIVLSWAGTGTHRATEVTAQMEQLAGRIDRAGVLHADTARQLEQLINLPQYDCTRVACSRELQDRNRAARVRLETAIAGKMHPRAFVASGHAD